MPNTSFQTFVKIWAIDGPWRLISLGKRFYHIQLLSLKNKTPVSSVGAYILKSGTLHRQRWSPDFNPNNQKPTNLWTRMKILGWNHPKRDILSAEFSFQIVKDVYLMYPHLNLMFQHSTRSFSNTVQEHCKGRARALTHCIIRNVHNFAQCLDIVLAEWVNFFQILFGSNGHQHLAPSHRPK